MKKNGEQITRTCRGYAVACVFLNQGELEALRRLLSAYIATEDSDPDLPRLRRLLATLNK